MPPAATEIKPSKLVIVNRLLMVLVILTGLYLTLSPFYPQVSLWVKRRLHPNFAPYGGDLAAAIDKTKAASDQPTTQIPDDNRLVIPRIQLNMNIFEGKYSSTLDKGPWRIPFTSTPDRGSNTVIAGHRWTYGAASDSFINLDKIKLDDPIAVYWQKKEYLYQVVDIKVVHPSDIEVEMPTTDETLTLYTCTPMWTSRDRLVVIAKRINKDAP